MLGNALTPGRGFREGPFNTEEELRDLVDLAEERHLIESGERAMIHGVFELGDTIVRSVMVPRPDIVSIERDKTLRQAMSLCLRSGYSRIPVLGENEDDIIGIIYLKDLVRRTHEVRDSENSVLVEQVMRTPTFVPDSKPVDELLREMQSRHIHVAVVVDEYGGTAGLVTIEDILEEIVGEITDEYDRELPRVETLDEHTMRVTARLPVDELNELFGTEIEVEDVDTVGGLLASALGRVPIPGAEARVDGLVLTAERAAGRRNQIGTVVVRRVVPDRDEQPATPTPPTARSPQMPGPDQPLDPEDAKILTLARVAQQRCLCPLHRRWPGRCRARHRRPHLRRRHRRERRPPADHICRTGCAGRRCLLGRPQVRGGRARRGRPGAGHATTSRWSPSSAATSGSARRA